MTQEPLTNPKLPGSPQALQRLCEHNGLTWLDLNYPGPEQADYLRSRFGFHPQHINDVLIARQRPKLVNSDEYGYLFLVLHVPVYNEMARVAVIAELDIFVGNDYVVTSHNGTLRPLLRLVQYASDERHRAEFMDRGAGYLLYRILDTLINATVPLLERHDQALDRIDERIFVGDVQDTVQELSFLRRDVISLRRIVRPNLPVLRGLASHPHPQIALDQAVYFGSLADTLSRLWDMLEEQKEIIEGLDATLSSLTSHRINREMKRFTLISLIFLPMTLVASILGMNVVIPLAEHPFSLVGATLLMLLLSLSMLQFFRYKNWM